MSDLIRFYCDEHISLDVVEGLRQHKIVVFTTQQEGRIGTKDPQQLSHASSLGCVIVTQDRDFLQLHDAGTLHTGIAYAPQGKSVGQLIRWLLLLASAMTAEEMVNRVERFLEVDP